MHKLTHQLRNDMVSNHDDSYERVRTLKNALIGETIYILAPGPSLRKAELSALAQRLSNHFTIALKQSYNYINEYVDMQLINFCNLDQYTYKTDCIVGWTVWNEQQPYDILNNNFRCDFILDTYKLGNGLAKLENSIAATGEFDKLSIDYSFARPWGPGTMYEVAIPLAVYMGCSEIITIGWDLFGKTVTEQIGDDLSIQSSDHYAYDNLTYKQTETRPSLLEAKAVIDSTEHLNKWLISKGVTLTIYDPAMDNPASNKINRITTL